jgi:hypothetical protein
MNKNKNKENSDGETGHKSDDPEVNKNLLNNKSSN